MDDVSEDPPLPNKLEQIKNSEIQHALDSHVFYNSKLLVTADGIKIKFLCP